MTDTKTTLNIHRVGLTKFISPDVTWEDMNSLLDRLNKCKTFNGEFSLLHRSEGGLCYKRNGTNQELTVRCDFGNWPSNNFSFASAASDLVLYSRHCHTHLGFDNRFNKNEAVIIAAVIGHELGWTPVRSKNYIAVKNKMVELKGHCYL